MKLNLTQESKIIRFLDDEAMSDSVKQVLTAAFLKPKPNRDVYQLAASRIAIDLLEEAWRELEKFRSESEVESKEGVQVGL